MVAERYIGKGDKIYDEIKAGNEMGIVTVLVKSEDRRHSHRVPQSDMETPDKVIHSLQEIFNLL